MLLNCEEFWFVPSFLSKLVKPIMVKTVSMDFKRLGCTRLTRHLAHMSIMTGQPNMKIGPILWNTYLSICHFSLNTSFSRVMIPCRWKIVGSSPRARPKMRLEENIYNPGGVLLPHPVDKWCKAFCLHCFPRSGLSDSLIQDIISSYLVLPNRITIPLVGDVELAQLRFPMPKVPEECRQTPWTVWELVLGCVVCGIWWLVFMSARPSLVLL